MQKSGETVEFVYNENGLRVQKTATSTGVTKYTLHGKNIVHMTQGSNELHFFYDAPNKPAVVVYNGVPYSYVKNLQGDIVAILDSSKTVVVSYVYDAWGRPISCLGTMASTLGKINPFRYRGYVYDEETGLYYLRTRYYHAEWCKFCNADSVIGASKALFDLALYSYAANRPINNSDSNGQYCETAFSTVLSGNNFGNHELIQGTMCSCEFIYYLRQMVDRKWRYPKRGSGRSMEYLREESLGEVDCVGVYRYILKWYYTGASYKAMLGYGKNNSVYNVADLYTYGTQYTGDLNAHTLEWNVWPGMALFEYDESRKGKERWRHVAYYIGITEEYGHTIIESYDWGKTMRMTSVDLTRYNYYGQLEGIHVCFCNAVEAMPIN